MRNTILCGDVREQLRLIDDESVNCVVTSPPYWGLRDYGVEGQLGLEATPEEFVCNLVDVFREVRRVLRSDGTVWLNLGDSYAGSLKGWSPSGPGYGGEKQRTNAGSMGLQPTRAEAIGLKPKDLVGIPWRVAFALQADGWWLRSDIIWSKPNPMPESVTDRPTKAHEYIFLLSKSERYYYDAEAIREPFSPVSIARISQPNFENQHGGAKDYGPDSNRSMRKTLENFAASHRGSTFTKGKTAAVHDNVGDGERHDNLQGRNKRTVWEIATEPYAEAHFATFPTELVKPCILAGCPEKVCAKCGNVVKLPYEKNNARAELQVVRDDIRESSTGQDEGILQQDMLLSVDSSTQENDQGIRDNAEGLHHDLSTGSPNVEEVRLRAGASSSNGGTTRAIVGTVGSSGSHQRSQERQPSTEPKSIDEGSPRQTHVVESHVVSDMPLLQPSIPAAWQCPRCGGNETAPGIVLDIFLGSGTTALVAKTAGRDYIGIELNPEYVELAKRRINVDQERLI